MTAKVKVLFVVPQDKFGKVPTWAIDQIRSVQDVGVSVHTIEVPTRNKVSALLKLRQRVLMIARREDVNYIHILWGGILGFSLTCFFRYSTVVSFCGSDLLGSYTSGGGRAVKGYLSRFFSLLSSLFADVIIVKAEFMKRHLFKMTLKKVHVVSNGVDTSKFFPMDKTLARKKLGLDMKKKYILFLYRPGAWVKNPERARQIAARLEPSGFELLVKYGIPHDKMRVYYSAIDFLLITSYHEGSSNSIKEALCCNCKVISTPVGDAVERLSSLKGSLVSNEDDQIVAFMKDFCSADVDYAGDVLPLDINNVADQLLSIYKTS